MNSTCRTLLLILFCFFAVASSAFSQQPATAIPTTPAPPSNDMKMMQRIEAQWDDALAKKDQYALELVLSPQFIDISSTGEVTTRNQQIARLFLKEGSTIPKLEQKVVTVRMFGDISLVNGTYSLQKKKAARWWKSVACSRTSTSECGRTGSASIRSAPSWWKKT